MAYSFVSNKLRVKYGILDVYCVTAGISVATCGFLEYGRKDFVLSYLYCDV